MNQASSEFTGKRILVAEDYFVNQEVTQDLLELLGLSVDIAENGREAVEKYEQNEHDLILMDIQMPELDGYTATQEIRKKEKEKENHPITIIALTANALSGDREKCLEAGMDDYISKPIEADKLEAILKKYLSS